MFEDEKEIKALVQEITKKDGKRHKYYKDTVEHAKAMSVHIEGCKPTELLEEKRPNEPIDVRYYRLKVWKNVTESLSGKVLHTISKIFDPKLFRIKYPESPSKLISEDESLENYLNNNFGVYKNLFVFIRETLLTKEMADPNALCVVLPQRPEVESSNYYEPIPYIFKSKYLVDFIEDEYYVLWVHEEKKNQVASTKGELWILTKESIRKYKVDTDKKIILEFELQTGFLPAFRLGGVVNGERNPYWFKSFIAGIQPHWDKVVTMVSDLDGSIVNHLFPTPWEWTIECNTCHGEGFYVRKMDNSKEEAKIKCDTCSGSGRMASKSPFGGYSVKREAIPDGTPPVIPPAGFITKDIAPIQELKILKDEEILKGFEAINMEVIHRSGANQSGIAKTIDRADLDAMLMRIAQHVFDCNVYYIIKYVAIWRYKDILSEDVLKEYLRNIEISSPKEFSVIGVNMLMEELKAATGTGVSSNYLRQLESEIVSTRFSNNDFAKKKNLAIVELKPFPGMSSDEISLGVSNKTIKLKDAVRNTYIDELVTLAVQQDEEFLELEYAEKLAVINGLIEENYLEEVQPPPIPVQEDDSEEDLEDGGEADE